MFQLIGETSFPFMKYRAFGYISSGLFVLCGIGAMVWHAMQHGTFLNFGIDFAGGTTVQMKFISAPPVDELRARLEEAGLKDVSLQRFGSVEANEIMVRVAQQTEQQHNISEQIRDAIYTLEERQQLASGRIDLNNAGRAEIAAKLAESAGGGEDSDAAEAYRGVADAVVTYRTSHDGLIGGYEEVAGLDGVTPQVLELLKSRSLLGHFTVLGVESVGPAVGKDLKDKAIGAIISAMAGLLIYIWFRFQLRFGIAAVVCLVHDVIVTVGAIALTNREVNLPVVAALLTIVGYSLNDTIVIFDRIRDNLRLMRKESFPALIDASINQTLSRTILTSLTVLVVVLALFFFGGPTINGFAFALLVGVIAGSYSTIFVASAFLLDTSRGSRPRAS